MRFIEHASREIRARLDSSIKELTVENGDHSNPREYF
jgi:hypothetical protein